MSSHAIRIKKSTNKVVQDSESMYFVSLRESFLCCFSYIYTSLFSVLVDDTEELGEKWEEAGGIFICHTSTKDTLKQLREKGILEDKAPKIVTPVKREK